VVRTPERPDSIALKNGSNSSSSRTSSPIAGHPKIKVSKDAASPAEIFETVKRAASEFTSLAHSATASAMALVFPVPLQ